MVGKIISVIGRVQGVGYRRYTLASAQKNNITGMVKNMDDGSVLIHAFGEESNLINFIASCKKGPSYSDVENLKISATPLIHFTSFEIVR